MFRPPVLMRLGLMVCLAAVLGLSRPAATRAQGGPTIQAVPNEYILFYEPGTPQADLEARVAATGSTIIDQIPALNAVVVRVTTRAVASTLRTAKGVTYLEANLMRFPTITPNDPDLSSQWALGAIHAYSAWDVTHGTGQVIAVLDTGVDLDHPDLVAHILPGYDYIDHDTNPSPDPAAADFKHGTHVAGIANAVTDNAIGMAGVAWDARTLPVRIIGMSGGASSSNIALGIVYATDHGATVINLSLGGPGWVKIERDAVNYAAAHGVIVVASAGNDNLEVPYYPASYDHVINVASTTSANDRSSFSNYGGYIDIAAPGSGIYSTLYDNTYGTLSGTSMAAPQVAGVVALIRSAGHATTLSQIMEALLCSAQDLGASGWDKYYGWGLVRADNAVNYIPGTNACLPTVAHDDFNNARTISTFYTDTVNTSKATSWIDDPYTCGSDSSNSADYRTVWYRFSPVMAGTLKLNTLGSTYDTVLAVYTGTRGSLTQVGCNNDTAGTTSALTVGVNAGQTVSIMVASRTYEGGEGTLTFNAVFVVPSGCVPFPAASGTILCTSN